MKKGDKYKLIDVRVIESDKEDFGKEFLTSIREGYLLEGDIKLIEYCGKIIYCCIMVKEEKQK